MSRRQGLMGEASQLVQEGDAARESGELQNAVQNYKAAVDTLPVAPMADALRAEAVSRFANASVAYARERAAGGYFAEAEALVDTVLGPGYDPSYGPAVELKVQLQDPEFFNRASTPEHLKNVAEVNRLLIQADALTELGRFQEASETYGKVLNVDPYNVAARQGMERSARHVSGYLDSARDQTRSHLLGEVDAAWETSTTYEADLANLFGDGGLASESSASSVIATKLDEIIFPSVDFSDATLQEVVTYLVARSKTLDNTGDSQPGVNIILDRSSAGVDTGIAERRVTLRLANVPLRAVLRFITDVTRTRSQIQPYAISIVDATSSAAGNISTRTFRVPPNFLAMSSSGADEPDDPFATPDVNSAGLELTRVSAQDFLSKNGITFSEGMSAKFIPSMSTLVVTNTDENLDLVDQLVADSFALAAQQVKIDVIMLETTEEYLQELGFDWLLGGANVPGSDRVFFQGGTEGNSPQSTAGLSGDFPLAAPGSDVPLGTFPVTAGNRSGGQIGELTNSISSQLEQNSAALTNAKAPGTFTVSGVLTDPQFQLVIRTLNQKTSKDIAMSPSIITRSGQRATIKVVRDFIYPIEFDPPEIPQNFGSNVIVGSAISTAGTGPSAIPATPATPTAFETRELGSSLEVEPVIDPNGVQVSLNLAPEFDEFEGFIDYGTPIRGVANTIITENRIIQPVFRSIKNTLTVDVFNGQTVVIGGLKQQRRVKVEDKVPGLGSLPGVGRLFRSDVSQVSTQVIVFMVRATIIDPAGNPIAIRSAGR